MLLVSFGFLKLLCCLQATLESKLQKMSNNIITCRFVCLFRSRFVCTLGEAFELYKMKAEAGWSDEEQFVYISSSVFSGDELVLAKSISP
ncbi:hypothetical protein TW73_22615 [Pseudoalteromonas piscicida]|nr:hypothetical protein TW73_22615 [Pseudoalteromonas piscicida]